MKGIILILVAAIVLFCGQATQAFVQPIYTVDTSSSAQKTATFLTLPYNSTSQGAETGTIYDPNPPLETMPAIPEPFTVLLVGLGLVGTGMTRFRRH
jgi:hypothetical protein